MLSRRAALKLGAAGAVAGCAGDLDGTSAEVWPGLRPEAWQDDTALLSEESFPVGIAAGDPQADEVTLWTRYLGEGPLQLIVMEHDGTSWQEHTIETVTPDEAGFVHRRISHEAASRWYSYVFRGPEGRSDIGVWRAPPADGQVVVVFGGTSCTHTKSAPLPILSRAAEGGLGFFLYGGDNVYADSAETPEEYREIYGEALEMAGFRAIRAACGGFACWDDHEVKNDWGTQALDETEVRNGIAAFYEHMPGLERDPAFHYRSFRIADTLEIFVLDCRSERMLDQGIYLGEAQETWLIDGVTSSTATFKLVLNSVPIADLSALFAEVNKEDRWGGYPEQRARILEAFDNVSGVFFLSGDIHMGLVGRVSDEGVGEGIWDVVMCPGGSTGNAIADLMVVDDHHRFATSAHTYTRFCADPHTGLLRVEFIDGDGVVLYDESLESNP